MKKGSTNDRPGYQSTALGWIPDDWSIRQLKSVVNLVNGRAFKPDEWGNAGLPIIRIQNLNSSDSGFNYYQGPVEDKHLVYRGDILFAWSGTKGVSFGARVWNGDLAVLNQHIFKVVLKSQTVAPDYLLLVLRQVQEDVESKAHGFKSSFVHVKKADLDKTLLPLPPISQQIIIAAVLSTWDKAIAAEQSLIAALEKRHRALMQRLLTGRQRLKGFKGEWKEVRLGELFARVTRKNTEGNTTVVTISAQRGFVMQNDFFNKNVASDVTDGYFLVERGEFCYNKSYSNGYPWGATKRLSQFEKAVVTTLYICFGVKDQTSTSAEYFEYFFESGLLDRGLMKIAHEGGRAHGLLNVTPSDFFDLKVLVPSVDEQVAIARVLAVSEGETAKHKQRLSAMRTQKQGLMQVLLTGSLRVPINTNSYE